MDLSLYKAKPTKTIRQHTDELIDSLNILKKFHYVKDDNIYKLTKMACEYHDYGKANSEFQNRINNQTKFDPTREIAHNILSVYFIDKEKFDNIEEYYKVAFAVLNHHNYCNNIEVLQDRGLKPLIENLLSDFDTLKIKRSSIKKISNVSEDKDTIMIKGLLHKCDYSASGETIIEYENNFLENGLNNLLGKWKNDSRNKNRNVDWNDLQQFCKKNKDNNIIVIAQTGMGKTEAGLHWIGNTKGFFILPLKTAINAIYDRIKRDILENNDIENKVALLHSDSLSYYNKNNNQELDVMDYHKKSKQFSIPLSVSTIDQLFDFVFKYQGYELKLATLSYSKIVIDEIQMYGADILAYLIHGIKMVNKLGGKIAILTATLAPFIRDLLREGEDGIQFKESTFVNDIKRHNIKIYDKEIDSSIIYEKFINNENMGKTNKILVVCNTVKKAQQIYSELNDFGLKDLNILHSKFIKYERSKKEDEILEFGKTEKIGNGIWITTQIVEASLDIDFDYLYTELSDISGLFQRLGRCNRKGQKSVDEHNCFIFLNINKNLLTDGKNKGFIDKKIYEISRNAIKNIDGVLTEKDKVNIINENLTTERINGSHYKIQYDEFIKYIQNIDPYEIDYRDIQFRNIISYDVIPESIYDENCDEIDENASLILESDITRLKKVELREIIKNYTVPVGVYDIYSGNKNAIVKRIKLSKNEEIYVVKCKYDELGFVRLSAKEMGSKMPQENYDRFF